MGQYKLLASES